MVPPLFPLEDSRTSRRSFLKASTSLAAAALWTSCASGPVTRRLSTDGYPFSLGVASGDPAPDGVVIWTRLAPSPLEGGGMPPVPVEVAWIMAEDEQLTRVVGKGKVKALPEWGHSVHVEVNGLQPDRWYWYQFKVGGDTSPLGRTRTMPAPGSIPEKFRFAFASCQHYETGYYTAYEHMIQENLDLIVHLGDYIYEDGGRVNQVRRHVGSEIMTINDYRNRYAQYKSDPALQAMHAAAPWIVTPDDHEVDNNYAGEISEHFNVSPRQLLQRRAAAYQAYYEHMPLRRSSLPQGPDIQLFRRLSIGQLAEFFVLDTRQYRSDQPCGDRNGPQCQDALSPKMSLLGARQRDWLFNGLAGSSAKWNILAQQVMMGLVDRSAGDAVAYSMDQWPGYEIERRNVLNYFQERKISNPVVLTGDIHTNWANELCLHTDQNYENPVAVEFVGTSISSSGDGRREPNNLDKILAENPFVKFHNAERGYVKCELSANQWRTDYRTLEYVSKKNSPIHTRKSFVVESGRPKLNVV